tara:strand:+ start:635 stop:1645 length:1011 start_codon:yes stop_codon:yes gene_type:complete
MTNNKRLLTKDEEISHGTKIQIAAQASNIILREAEAFMRSEPSSETALHIHLLINKSKNIEYNFERIEEIALALIAKLPPGSEEKEQRIRRNLEKVKVGGWAKGQMIVRNQGLVRKLAMTHSSQYVTQDDLIQQGNEGLIRAVEKFDPDMGNKFSTYARDWIKQTINRYVDEQHTIKIPEYLRNKITRIRKAQNNYLQSMGQEAPIFVLASECEMSENEVETLLSIKPDAISLNKSFGDGESDLENFIEDEKSLTPEDAAEETMIKQKLKSALEALSPEERVVIVRRYALDGKRKATLKEIGDDLGLSKEAVRLKEQRVLKKLQMSTDLQHLSGVE